MGWGGMQYPIVSRMKLFFAYNVHISNNLCMVFPMISNVFTTKADELADYDAMEIEDTFQSEEALTWVFAGDSITHTPTAFDTEITVTPFLITVDGKTIYGKPVTKTVSQGMK